MKTIQIPISDLRRHSHNARHKKGYTRKAVAGLAASIREHGLLQPLVVASRGSRYVLLAGHRRLAALKSLKIKEAPCLLIEEESAESQLSILLGDNALHEQVDPLLEADTTKRFVDGLAGEEHPLDRAASILGKSVAWIRSRLRLTQLSASWRTAFADPASPISEFPSGHLSVIAALDRDTQERAFEQWRGWWHEGVPIRADLVRMVNDLTSDLAAAPWDLDDEGLVEGAPACLACPKRDSQQGALFADSSKDKSDRCLSTGCYQAKRRAFLYRVIAAAQKKYGDALRIESAWAYRDLPLPEEIKTHREHELTPRTKKQGGCPVLRLRTMKVTYMGLATQGAVGRNGPGAAPLSKDGRPVPKSLAERREALGKRRLVRALELLQGSLLGRPVEVGTKKRPETVEPPQLTPPSLQQLIVYVIAYGTSPSVDPQADGLEAPCVQGVKRLAPLAADTATANKAAQLRTRTRLWNRVREPLSRALRPFSGMSLSSAKHMEEIASTLARHAGADWEAAFLNPAIAAIPEPSSWRLLNEDGTRKSSRQPARTQTKGAA